MPPFIRSEVLNGFFELLERDPELSKRIRDDFNLPDDVLAEPNNLIPYPSFARALEQAATGLGCPHFGVLLALVQKPIPIGAVGLLMKNCPDLGTGLQEAIRYYHLHSEGNTWRVFVDGGTACLVRADCLSGIFPAIQASVYNIACIQKAIRTLAHPAWTPDSVWFTHAPPGDQKPYNDYFQAEVVFGQDFDGLVFPAADLRRPIEHANDEVRRVITQQFDALKGHFSYGDDVRGRVKMLIQSGMTYRKYDLESIATLLGTHPKKLQRMLRMYNTSFRELVQEVRLATGARYLQTSNASLTRIAELVGYSAVSAFSRAFKEQFGITPREWRKQKQETASLA